MRGLSDLSHREDNYEEIEDIGEDEKVLQLAMKKAPLSVRVYIWMRKTLTNPLITQRGELLERSIEKLR